MTIQGTDKLSIDHRDNLGVGWADLQDILHLQSPIVFLEGEMQLDEKIVMILVLRQAPSLGLTKHDILNAAQLDSIPTIRQRLVSVEERD